MIKLPVKNKKAYYITDRLIRKFITGIDIAEGVLLITDTMEYYTDARYFSGVSSLIESKGITAKLYQGQQSLKEFIDLKGLNALMVDYNTTTVKEFNELKKLGVKIQDCSATLQRARAKKSGEELKSIKKACKIVEQAVWFAIQNLTLGMTEIELKDILEEKMISLGGQGVSFETIVAFGENSAVPHHQTGNTKLKENSVILIDAGCKVNGYCSDITRTFFYGKPNQNFIDCYNAVLKANLIAIENIRAGTVTKDADAFARDVLKEKGLDKYFTHSLGHGVGLEIHEYPSLSSKTEQKLINGMVFTIEPGVYIDGEFGIRIEDTVMLSKGKVKRLYTDDKQLKLIKN